MNRGKRRGDPPVVCREGYYTTFRLKNNTLRYFFGTGQRKNRGKCGKILVGYYAGYDKILPEAPPERAEKTIPEGGRRNAIVL